MDRGKRWLKALLMMLVGAAMVLIVQGIGDRWHQRADAAGIDDLARNAMTQLIQSFPLPGGQKIKGVSGLGDGKTFVVWTNDQIYFYRLTLPPTMQP